MDPFIERLLEKQAAEKRAVAEKIACLQIDALLLQSDPPCLDFTTQDGRTIDVDDPTYDGFDKLTKR